MGSVDWSLLPPSPWSEEELREFARKTVEEARERRGYDISDQERRRILQQWHDEAVARRGYELSDEERERGFFECVREARIRGALKRAAQAQPGEYQLRSPSGPLAVHEGRPGETQLDRLERELNATRVRLEALESKVNMFFDHLTVVEREVDDLTVRVDGLEKRVPRTDLRVLRLESED